MPYLHRLHSAFKNRILDHPTVLFFTITENHDHSLPSELETCFPEMSHLEEFIRPWPKLSSQLALYEQRFLAGDQVCLTMHKSELAHVSWFGPRHQLEADYELGPGILWPLQQCSGLIYDCWTPPTHRGKGIYPATLRALSGKLLQDYPEVWIYCREENTASRRGIEKAGFKYQGQLSSLKIFGRTIHV